jgi:hypothetical protein
VRAAVVTLLALTGGCDSKVLSVEPCDAGAFVLPNSDADGSTPDDAGFLPADQCQKRCGPGPGGCRFVDGGVCGALDGDLLADANIQSCTGLSLVCPNACF